MKIYLSFVVAMLLSVSSYAQKFVGTVPKPEGAFVLFADGTRIEGNAEVLKDREALNKPTIVLDGNTYKTDDIKKYSDGEKTFLKIDDSFAEQIFGDKIKVYRVVYKMVGVIGKGGKWHLNPEDFIEYDNGDIDVFNYYFIKKKLPGDFKMEGRGFRGLYESVEAYNTGGSRQIREMEYISTGKNTYKVREKRK